LGGMSAKNCTLIGMALIATATIVIWNRPIALIPLIIGIMFIARPIYLDTKYGEDRPTKREIDAMPLDEYREKIRNPKFRKWVDNLKITIPPTV
jgi:hypothetical protein